MNSIAFSKRYRQLNICSWLQLGTREWLWDLLAASVPWAVYLRTLAPTVYGLDSAELTSGAYALGIVHAPGSPLFLLLGHLFTWLPVGDVGYRLNLMAASAAAVAALFVYRILRDLTRQRWIALLATWLLAFSYYFWISAVAAELYALQASLVAALVWLALQWREHPQPWRLYLFAFLYGLGLGNHLSLVLLAPGMLYLVLNVPSQPWRNPRLLALAALCGLLGASIYFYLPLRYLADPSFNYARDYWDVNLATWDGFWWMVTGRMFRSLFFAIPPESWSAELLLYVHRLWSNFIGLGFVIGLLGLIVDFRRRPAVHTALALMFLGHLAFYVPYGAADKDTMFLPTFLIWGLWVGLGFNVLREQIERRAENGHGFLPALLLLLVTSSLALNWRLADQSQNWQARQRGTAIFETVEDHAFYLGTWADVPILEYLQQVEQQRRDVTAVNLFFTGPARGAQLALEELRKGYPVYTSAAWLASDDLVLEAVDACRCYHVVLRGGTR